MTLIWSLIAVIFLLLIACGLVLWLLVNRGRVAAPQHGLQGTTARAAPLALQAGHAAASAPVTQPGVGPDTVAVLNADGDAPDSVIQTLKPSSEQAKATKPLRQAGRTFEELTQSTRSEPLFHHSDFANSTLPQPLVDIEVSSWVAVNPDALKRIQEALQAMGDGSVDAAWSMLKNYYPEATHRETALETFERIALAFERAQRYDSACDVYEHMAEIAPQWRQVKLRLMRVRGLTQPVPSKTSNMVVPRQHMPSVTQRRLGKYMVERLLGKGAMGAVYLGYDPATDQQVAIKTMALTQEFQSDAYAEDRRRFMREAEIAGRLKHPDIVSIVDVGEENGLAYIAMELITGLDLSHHVNPARLLPLNQLLPIVARVAEALAYAHSRGVFHRDVKPANIMVDLKRGSVKVMDFGVARLADAARTRTGVVLGTPTFMSPEQLSGQVIDGRSDLYSLGVTLFQLLTGQLPYRNDTMSALMRAIAHDEAPNVCAIRPDLPTALGDVVALALEKHPTTRYATGHQMAEDLRTVARMMQELDIVLN